MLECLLQFSGASRTQASQPLETLAQARQSHRQVEPIEQVARVGSQVALELTQTVLAVRKEHELLVMLQALAPEHLSQVPSRPRVVALHEAEALGGAIPWNRLTHDRHEVRLFVVPVSEIAAIEANGDRRWRRG